MTTPRQESVVVIHLVHVESDNVTLAIHAEVTGELSIRKSKVVKSPSCTTKPWR